MDLSIFKAYDIRGIYPETMNEEMAQKIGVAFVNRFNLKKVAVGRDGRISSPQLEDALVEGIKKAGASVTRIGVISTDMVYFASANFDFDGGVIVTASHNPSEHNGFKLTLKDAVPVNGDEGLFDMRDSIDKNELTFAETEGQENELDIYEPYVKKLQSLINIPAVSPMKIVIDAGNGVGGFVAQKVLEGLPLEIIPLYFEIDGNFPNHQPSPIEEKNLADLKLKVKSERADFGLAFDGDGDRVYMVDENGEGISASVLTAMIAKSLLLKKPGAKILYNVICGWIVPETIVENGGTPVITKVGHSLIKSQMRREDGLFAGEHSGHYYYKDLSYADSGMMTMLLFLELVSLAKEKVSVLAQEFNKYFLSGEINSEVEDKEKILELLEEKFSDGKISKLDGLSVEYSDWRFNVRPSNTESLLRLNVEAKNKKVLDQKVEELLSLIRA